jgi:surface antigen
MESTRSQNRSWGPEIAVGIFRDRESAESGIRALRQSGFDQDQIGVALRDRGDQSKLMAETGTKATEGAATGAAGGGVIGGLVGLLVGTGALMIPGLGPVLAGGALASILGVTGATAVAGASVGAATGGILGALVGSGISEEEARYFDESFRGGGTLVTVSAGPRVAEARRVLAASGADIGPAASLDTTQWSAEADRRQPDSFGRRRSDVRSAGTP